MTEYRIREDFPEEQIQEFAAYSNLIGKLLYHRGIRTKDEADRFMNPSYDEHIHDPYLMKDMDKAVERIIRAVKGDERIIVFTDYDHDGVPAGVLLSDFLEKIGCTNFRVYIPHRHNEGFGLNHAAIEEFVKEGASLMITADCGVADAEEITFAQSKGIDVIITDHHMLNHGIPPAYAVLDPKREDCMYPEKNLCGSGVAYKLVQGVLAKERFGVSEGWEKWLLDMVGIATLSDMVPLIGENRVFAHYGLLVMRKTPRLGLQRLFAKVGVRQNRVIEDDIGFGVSPRINAASRMGVPYDAYLLLKTKDETEAGTLIAHLEKINRERKGIVASIVRAAKGMIAERYDKEKRIIVLGDPEWRPALLGLVANSIAEQEKCPVFLWGREGQNLIKGSCRSYGNVNLQDVMNFVPKELFTEYGGHAFAGGFAVSHDMIHDLPRLLEEAVSKVTQEVTSEVSMIDHEVEISRANHQFYNQIRSLAPFGEGNPRPVFLFRAVEIIEMKNFGKNSEHIELTVSQGFDVIKAIQFFYHRDRYDVLKKGMQCNIVGYLEQDMFSGGKIRIRIQDFFV